MIHLLNIIIPSTFKNKFQISSKSSADGITALELLHGGLLDAPGALLDASGAF